MKSLQQPDKLEPEVNEWYLFHGTSCESAQTICRDDFKFHLAGRSTGKLFGQGVCFAESITKADEYATEEDGCCTVLLCRVLGGRVRYCEEKNPDAARLVADCANGPYNCILGDRRKASGTYREFVFFDAENIYPEYILKYTRGDLFAS